MCSISRSSVGLEASNLIKLKDLLNSNNKLQKVCILQSRLFTIQNPTHNVNNFLANNLTADYYDIYSININEPIPTINYNNSDLIVLFAAMTPLNVHIMKTSF